MKLGIVGSGKIVQEFLPWLAQSPAVQVAALCSTERSAPQARALCEQYGVPLHTTEYRQLLASVDTVYIALPNLLHTAYARAALEAGKGLENSLFGEIRSGGSLLVQVTLIGIAGAVFSNFSSIFRRATVMEGGVMPALPVLFLSFP